MWRVINVVIGAGIDTLIGCAFLPVTTRSAVNLVMDGILHHLVEISAATADLLTPEGAESLSKDFSRAASTLSGNSSKFFEPLTTTSTLPSPREVELTGVPLAQPSEAGTPVDVEAGVRLQLVDGRQNVAVVEPMNAPLPSPFSRLPAIHIEPTTASPGSASPNARSPASPASPTAMYYAAESPRKLSVRRERSKWIKRKALGGPAMQLRPMWLEVSEGLSVLKELSAIAEFEEKLLPRCVRTVTVQVRRFEMWRGSRCFLRRCETKFC